MGSMESEQLGKGGDGMGLRGGISLYRCGWRSGNQEGVNAKASEESIDIKGGRVGQGGGGEDGVFVAVLVLRKAKGRWGIVVVVVGEPAFWLV